MAHGPGCTSERRYIRRAEKWNSSANRPRVCSDVGGVRITSSSLTIPPTPPPDIDVEAWHRSIERVAAWQPRRLAMTHFGSSEDVSAQLDEVGQRLDDWAQRARQEDLETFVAGIGEEIRRGAEPGTPPAYAQAAPPEQMYLGLDRYWRKRMEPSSDGDSAERQSSDPRVS